MTAPYRDLRAMPSGGRFAVFRARRAEDGRPVVLKRCRGERPDPRGQALLRHEHELLRRLEVPGVVRALGMETIDGELTLVLEDAGPQNLAELVRGRPLDPGRFLDLAIAMAEVVGELHRRNVIHRDVCPENFVVGEAVTVVDFAGATVVPAFTQKPGAPGTLEGTLAYMAPEQTGRTRHLVDHRADLYALGATFYEMLTGAPPFAGRDPLELVHAHVARAPYAPALVHPGVPTLLSDIVLKLLAKTPEWRYQSAEALRLDLEQARREWRAKGAISKFEIGRFDVPHGLFVHRRVYGRDAELRELEQAFERAAAGGREVVVISGRAGVGKTTLVRGLQESVGGRCRWLEGKGDLLRGNVPHAPIIDAVGALTSMLAEPPESAERLRERLRTAVGPAGRVLVESIPGLDRLVGEQPPVPEVGPVEAVNRLHLAFAAFIGALGERGAVTVLFLDDLQWADSASIEFLRAVAADPESGHLLVLAAFREEEVAPDHPVRRAIEAMERAGPAVRRLALRPLDEETLVLLLRDLLRISREQAEPLATIVAQKTAGNPFAVRRLLGWLNRAGLLGFDAERGEWTWDLRAIAALGVSEDAGELAAANIQSQPPGTQEVLEAAACIGNQFDLATLATVLGRQLDDVAQTLWGPLRDGLVVPSEGSQLPWAAENPVELPGVLAPSYRFAHDRIQQAAYDLLEEDRRVRLHLRIGRHLLRALPPALVDEAICFIVDQLDRAASRAAGAERIRLAELNLRAGLKARGSAAHVSALAYFRQGLALLPADGPRVHHGLWFLLQRGAAECAALAGDHALADQLIDDGLARAAAVLEKVAFYAIAIVASTGRGFHERALLRGEEALRLLGMDLARDRAPAVDDVEQGRARDLVATRAAEERPALAGAGEPEAEARLQLLLSLSAPAWYVSAELYKAITARATRLALERGVTPEAATACASYAVALALDGEYAEAHRAGRFSLALAERAANSAQLSMVLMMVGGHVNPWREPLRQSLPLLRRSLACGIQSGELVFSAYAAEDITYALMAMGADLDQVIAEAAAVQAHFRKTGRPWDALQAVVVRQVARRLKGVTRSWRSFDDQEFDEEAFLAATTQNVPARALFHLYRLEAAYLLGDLGSAAESSEALVPLAAVFRSLFLQVDCVFYRGLVLAAQCEQASPGERTPLLRRMEAERRRLETWADNAPANWSHKRDLLAAEIARIEGRASEALGLYQEAVEGAGREGFRQDEALAHELCGRFHARRGAKRMAALHLGAAADAFARWGATVKVEQLRRQEAPPPPRPSSVAAAPALDYASLLKLGETLTGELELDRLLEKMIRISVEAASAERAVLVLGDGELVVRATADATGEVTLARTSLAGCPELPTSFIERVHRSGEAVVLGDAAREAGHEEPYFARHATKSVLAVPIGDPARGVLYFENDLGTDAFTSDRVETFRLLSAPIAIALHNSLLFEERQQAEAALRLIVDAGAALAESLDYETTVRKVARLAVPALADWCIVDVFEDGALSSVAYSHVDPWSTSCRTPSSSAPASPSWSRSRRRARPSGWR